MRHRFILVAALLTSAAALAAPAPSVLFSNQLDCTTQQTLDMAREPGSETVRASKAADVCVTEKDLADSQPTILNVTPSPEAQRKALADRKASMVQGTLRRIAMCRAEGIPDSRLGAECGALFKTEKGSASTAK